MSHNFNDYMTLVNVAGFATATWLLIAYIFISRDIKSMKDPEFSPQRRFWCIVGDSIAMLFFAGFFIGMISLAVYADDLQLPPQPSAPAAPDMVVIHVNDAHGNTVSCITTAPPK